MSEKREDSRRKNDELWDKTFNDNENLDSTGHLSRTERRKQESHSSTITTVLIVLIIVLAAAPLIYWINNKQSFNHPVRTEQTASVSSHQKSSHRVKTSSSRRSTSTAQSASTSSTLTSSQSAAGSYSYRSQTTNVQSSASNQERRYVQVQRGDNLTKIAYRNGTTARQLARLNNIAVNSQIRPGQQIRIR